MAFHGRRRTFQACYLHQHTCSCHLLPDEFTHSLPHFVIVGTHKSSIFVAVGLAVEEYHGNAFVVGLFDNGRECGFRVGRHHQQINMLVDKGLNLTNLQTVAVIGRRQFYLHIIIGISSGHHFPILLISPDIFATLRHTNLPFLGFLSASMEQAYDDNCHKRGYIL